MSNLAPILDQRLLPAQARLVRIAANASARHGVELYLVGGTIRDMLLGQSPVDLDLSAVDGTPEFASTLAQELHGEVVVRSQFGTSKLKIDDIVIDLAIAREESYAYPGALPTVAPGSIYEDLARRDFTINAMAISLTSGSLGELVDPFNGQRDLQDTLIRVLHPDSFADDATRILRAVRYAQRLGFRLEAATEGLIRRDLCYLDAIKGDRMRHELQRIFREDNSASMLELAQNLGVLSAIYPGLGVNEKVLAKLDQTRIEPTAEKELVFLSVLAYLISDGDLDGLVTRLNLDTQWTKVAKDTGMVKDAFASLRTPDLKPSQLYASLRSAHIAAVRGCALAAEEPLAAQRLELFLSELRHVTPALNGDDLIALGVPEGPMVGRLLEDLLASRLDGELATEEDEKDFVARLQQGPR